MRPTSSTTTCRRSGISSASFRRSITRSLCSRPRPDLRARSSETLEVGAFEELRDHPLEAAGIVLIEAVRARAVDIEDAEERPAANERHHDFRARVGVAGDVAGERMHIRHDYRLAARGGRAAYAALQGDAHARHFALKRSEHQLAASQEIKSRPVELGQRVVNEGRGIGAIRESVALAREHAGQLLLELGKGARLVEAGSRWRY